MRHFHHGPIWMYAAAILAAQGQASAGPIPQFGPAPLFSERIVWMNDEVATGADPSAPEDIAFDDSGTFSGRSFSVSVRVTTGGGSRPGATVTGSVTRSNPFNDDFDDFDVTGNGVASYSFMVQPRPGVGFHPNVPLLITYNGEVTATATGDFVASGTAIVTLAGSNEAPFGTETLGRAQVLFPGGTDSFSGTVLRHFRSGGIGTLVVGGGAGGGGRNNGTADFQMAVDPLVVIDPTFSQKDDFEIVFNSPFVTPGVVPEPSTLLLAVTGTLAGCARRWRSKVLARIGRITR